MKLLPLIFVIEIIGSISKVGIIRLYIFIFDIDKFIRIRIEFLLSESCLFERLFAIECVILFVSVTAGDNGIAQG